MRVLYLDCFAGISGDMALGAMVACGVSPDRLRDGLGRLNVSGWTLDSTEVEVNGISATRVSVVQTDPAPAHRHLADIERIIARAELSERVRRDALAVFRRLAEAEAKVHGVSSEQVHFHEVGAIDAIVDVVGVCIALEHLGIEAVHCSPLPTSHGFVECEHGRIPVPAPAVVELTLGLPTVGADVDGEMVTPTGAALAATLAARFGVAPSMRAEVVGYGAGTRRWPDRPNLLRAVVGQALEPEHDGTQEIDVVETNLDDMNPQLFGPLVEALLGCGAVDAFLTPVQMKKGRPGTLVTALCAPEATERVVDHLVRQTTTLGVRCTRARRWCLEREWVGVDTPYGPVRMKVGRWKGAETTATPEFEDVRRAASERSVPVKEVYEAALAAYRAHPAR